ncbi:ImmA/IrrE family metallo-endopeptidase [Ruegeria sp. 2012CJ41-6]|uniref:ImmA/IrrE family metallo-endopeptidase n=1 Tax=Ruegeria spongiae TaxID=2942209 RepID=A0ABT0Q7B2_9RHOB|nr:ImmA/IrrE family metallo-endopeptidase [Ruegeria spongiae]MCL6285756.1 ImmA/IrrE family metallo-endopeptidase [Ruegeria spongiae]
MTPDKKRAREAAQVVLEEFGIKRIPVPVERIIKSKNIMLEYAPLDEELSGMAYTQDGISIIGINALHHPNRQRFSAAHELGHHVLHAAEINETVHVSKGLRALKRDPVSSQGSDPLEIDANTFASELLMPEKFLLEEIGPDGLDMEDETSVEKLAKRFRVSVAAMKFRLGGLI